MHGGCPVLDEAHAKWGANLWLWSKHFVSMQYPQQRHLTMAQEELWALVSDPSETSANDGGDQAPYLYCAATGRAIAAREGKKLPAVGKRCSGTRSWPAPLLDGSEGEAQDFSESVKAMSSQPVRVTIINDTPGAVYVDQVSASQPFGSLQPRASMVLPEVPSGHRLLVGGKALTVNGAEGGVQHILASHVKGRGGRKGKKGSKPARSEL